MQKFEKANFNIANYDETDNYGKFVIEPLERGYMQLKFKVLSMNFLQ